MWSRLSGLSILTPFCDKIDNVLDKIVKVVDRIVKVIVNGVPLNGIAPVASFLLATHYSLLSTQQKNSAGFFARRCSRLNLEEAA
jgi:hypothetical protein